MRLFLNPSQTFRRGGFIEQEKIHIFINFRAYRFFYCMSSGIESGKKCYKMNIISWNLYHVSAVSGEFKFVSIWFCVCTEVVEKETTERSKRGFLNSSKQGESAFGLGLEFSEDEDISITDTSGKDSRIVPMNVSTQKSNFGDTKWTWHLS